MKAACWLPCALLLSSTACDDEPAKGKPRAEVSQPHASARSGAARGTGTVFTISRERSSIEFAGAKLTRRHSGSFDSFTGTIRMRDGDPLTGTISLSIDVGSLRADDPQLTRHLKSPDFLDVERFPTATFSSTSISAGGADGASHTVTGDLSLHGVTKRVSFPARIRALSAAVEASAEFSISRKDFGVAYAGVAGDLIKEQVLLMVRLDARSDS